MKFGIFDHLDQRGEPLGQFYEDRLEYVAAVEAAGYYSYHIAEHHGTPLGMAPSPNIFLAAVARHTTTLRFGPLVYLVPLYHPVRLIEEICMLDHLSGGRLDVGVGRGVSPYEVACYGLGPDDRRPMFDEAMALLLKGLTSTELDHKGDWYKVEDMPMALTPLQKPYPPLWYGAANEAGARFSAENGMHFVTLGGNDNVKGLIGQFAELWEETRDLPMRQGSPVTDPLIGLGRHIFVAETDAEADRLAGPAYAHWYDNLVKLWLRHGAAPVTGMIIDNYEDARRVGQAVCGSVETVRDELAAQAGDMGFNYLVCQLAWGSLTHDQEMNSLAMFNAEVKPALEGL